MAVELANSVVAALDVLGSSGYGSLRTSLSPLDSGHAANTALFSAAQRKRMKGRIFLLARSYVRRTGAVCTERVDELRAIIAELSDYFSKVPAAPLPVVADRVDLPDSAGRVELLDFLSPPMRARYAEPSPAVLRFPPPSPAELPRPCFLVRKGDYAKLVARMLRCGMATLIDDPACINGLFMVRKKDSDRCRLILDGRPGSAMFVDPPTMNLPHAGHVASLRLSPDGLAAGPLLHTAKRDHSNFFYRWRIPAWMRRYLALPRIAVAELGLSEDELLRFGWRADQVLFPALVVLAMGHSHSPFLTQDAHEHFVYSRTSLRREDALNGLTDSRLDRLRHCICIDDVCWIGSASLNVVQPAVHEYERAVALVDGLELKRSKNVDATSEPVDVLGAEVDGNDATVRISAPRIARLALATQTVLDRGRASGELMAWLVGHWCWAMLVNRPALSAFRAVYVFIQKAGSSEFGLWPSVRKELTTALGLLPLLVADLRAPDFDRLLAFDASSAGQGLSVSFQPPAVLQDLQYEAMLQRRQLRAQASLPRELWSNPDCPPTILNTVSDAKWWDIVSSPWRASEHINSLEARAMLTAVRWSLSHPSAFNSHLTICTDSRVLFWAATKGRSSSKNLYPRLRNVAVWLLAFGSRLHVAWVPSAVNPSDAASRLYC